MPENFRATLAAVWQDPFCRRLIFLGMAVHLALAFAFHLSPDETHYALYSINPDWSFFDHPPLAGWLQWPLGQLVRALGSAGTGGFAGTFSDVLMRVLPMGCWALSAWGAAALAQVLFPQVLLVARAALVLWVLSVMPHLLGLALVPDSILMPIICMAMAVCWHLCDAAQLRNMRLWLALGGLLGLAGLTKYTAIFIGLGCILALFLAHGPRVLAVPGAWVGVVVAALLISPVLGWNAANSWISLAYQTGHAAGNADWRLVRVAGFVIVQLLGYGLLLVVGAWAARRVARHGGSRSAPSVATQAIEQTQRPPTAGGPTLSPLAFCLCFALPPLLLMVYLSGRGSTLPHWSVTAWLALLPAAAAGCVVLWQVARRRMIAIGVFQAVCAVGLFTLMLSGGVQRETGDEAQSLPGKVPASASFNPFTDLYGWDAAALRARALSEQFADKNGRPTLAVMSWTLASRIAWYAKSPTLVVQRHLDQFGLWWGVLQPGDHALVVDWSQMSFAPPVGPQEFERCELLEQQPVMRWGRQIAHFNFQLCRNWQGPKERAIDRR